MEIKYIRKSPVVLLLLMGLIFNISCKKFLDAKPTSNLTIINVNDLQGLIDDYATMNNNYPVDGEVSSDNYFISDADYGGTLSNDDRDFYVWKPSAQRFLSGGITYWQYPYKIVYNSNLILETLQKEGSTLAQGTFNSLKGSALFFRGYAHFSMAEVYAKPYDPNTASQDLGIPIRTTTALEDRSLRGTVQETYENIIEDLQEAATLLPATVAIKSRPSKAAAYAALARVYLAKQDYTNAGKMADECLKLKSTLIDYNTISKTSPTPFARFNDEVIFQSIMNFAIPLIFERIDKDLYNSYHASDLRKQIFFKQIDATDYEFSGNYDPDLLLFNGLATDEIYLIRAECYARAGNSTAAMADLNTLMQKRWDNAVPYPAITAISAEDALTKVLTERRKELAFRGLRWSDLRRLNKDNRFQKTLTRTVLGNTYTLSPNDLRYVLLINQDVVKRAGFQQNAR